MGTTKPATNYSTSLPTASHSSISYISPIITLPPTKLNSSASPTSPIITLIPSIFSTQRATLHSTVFSNSPPATDETSKSVSTKAMKCAMENERSTACAARKGKGACCDGLVCHVYHFWKCV